MLALQPCAPFVTKMMRASQGLPGVAVELLRTAWAQCRQRHKVVDCDPLALTGKGLRDIYRPRIKLLAPAARALLRYLSLWRRPCRLSWLFEMTDLQPDAGWAATETLLALGLIHLHDDRVALTQAAVGQAALKGIARKQRMRWKHIAVDVARRHLPEPLERVLQEPTACEHRDALVAMADVVASNPAESISSYADGPQILERAGEICLQDLQTDRSAALFHRAGQALARGDLALRPHAVDLMSRTVELWTQCGRYTRALQTIDEALGDLNPDEAQKSRLIYLQARVFQRQGNYEKAADLLTATSARGDVLTDHQRALLARVLLTQGNLKSAAELTATVSKQSDRPVAVELLETAGLVCFYAHRFKEARSLYERAQAQAAATRRPAFVARQLNLLGMIEHQSGRLDNAGSLYGRATEIAARCGDIHGLALYESNAGAVMWERGDFGSALDSLTQGVRDLLRLGKTAEWIGALLNLANTLLRLGDYTNAARKARSALEGAKRIGARPEHYKAMLLLADSGSWLRLSISLGRNDAVATSLDRRLQKAAAALKRIWPPNGDPIRLTQRAVAGFTALERKTELLFARAAHVIAVVAHEAWSPDLADQITALTNAVADPECDLMARLESLHALCLAFFNGPTSDALPTREWFDRHLDDSLTALQSTQLREWKWRLGYCAARMAALSGDLQRSSRHARNAHQILHTLLAETPQFHRAQRAADPEARLLQEFVETPASWRAEMSNADADLSPAAPLIPAAEIYRPGERSATHPSNGRQRPSSGAPASRREHRLRRLLAINKRLNSEHRLEPLLDQILDSVIDLTEAERGFLLLVEADQLRVVAARNMDKEGLERGQDARSRWSRSIAQRALESTEPILTVDAAEDERFSAASSVMDMQLRSVLTVPLLVKGKAVGTIYVDNRLRKGAFDESDAELALDFADQAALAIENARLVSENEARHQRIRQLNEQLQNRLDEQEATMHDIRAELISSRQALEMRYDYSNIVGSSPAMVKTFQLLDRITETDLPVVVQGESGTGKELVARAIHFNGARKKGAFVSENCGAVPDTLLESILFGHEKGAFTGANRQQRGLFEIADGGTLFLDEVGDMSLAMQVKLLRALQDGEFRRVGGDHVIKVDVRVVAASNRSLAKLVEDGTFRKDLYYRLNVVTITLPPLRQRTEDIPLLVAHFLKKHGPAGKALRIGPEALSRLQSFGWPGNVRQLENEIMRAAALCGDTIRLSDLSPEVLGTQIQPTDLDPDDLDLKKRVARLEKVLIQQALDRTDGNRTQAAKILGVSRYGLIKKLDRLGID
jgi:transcriptional regulator with GAF, ATPase, and Fis domain